jgi:hypothetical protein
MHLSVLVSPTLAVYAWGQTDGQPHGIALEANLEQTDTQAYTHHNPQWLPTVAYEMQKAEGQPELD